MFITQTSDCTSLKIFSYLFICLVMGACSHASVPQNSTNEAIASDVNMLTQAITSLSNDVPIEDADKASRLLINSTLELANQYNMTSPALYHNVLVNTGFRERGLCCHWAEDLHARLREIHSHSLKFDWLVTRLGSKLREHNTVVIYPANSSWEKGIVFDPWRTAGIPYWSKVSNDKYSWQRHPLNGQWNVLRCK